MAAGSASVVGARPRATVIGAGIVGVCCASYLQREGFEVEIVDFADPGTQCSFGNAGGICPGSCVPIAMPGMLKKVPGWLADPEGPLYVRLAYLPQAIPWILRFLAAGRIDRVRRISDHMRALHRLSFDCYEPLLKAAGCADLIEHHGQLFAYENAGNVEGDAFGLSLRRDRGVKIEILNEDELRQLAPSLSPIFKRGVFLPEQGQCKNPGRLVASLAEQVVRGDGRLIKARVRGFEFSSTGPRRAPDRCRAAAGGARRPRRGGLVQIPGASARQPGAAGIRTRLSRGRARRRCRPQDADPLG